MFQANPSVSPLTSVIRLRTRSMCLLSCLLLLLAFNGCTGDQHSPDNTRHPSEHISEHIMDPAVTGSDDPVPLLASVDGSYQIIQIIIDHGYRPRHLIAKIGKPIVLEFIKHEASDACLRSTEIPALHLKTSAPDATSSSYKLQIPSQQAGILNFQCNGKQYTGIIEVQ